MSLSAGSSLGRYEIVAAAGAGGMGEVFRARDTRLDRDVAIKVLPEEFSDDPSWLARFEREARSVSTLNHPWICTLHDIGHEVEAGGGKEKAVHFLVMEYIEGETLAARLEAGRIPLAEVLAFGRQVAEALAAAHQAGVIHRDLKPGNVMLTKSGAKLLDFGLAKPLDVAGETQLTAAPTMTSPLTAQGMMVGTYQYMAPEVLAGGEADARSDIFAFGALLYEAVAGRSAFEGQTQATLVASILKEEVRPLEEFEPQVPAALSRLIERCLAKDPEKRWQSAADLALELDWIASGGGNEAVRSTTDLPGFEDASSSAPPRLAWTLAALFGIVALVLGVNVVRSRDKDLSAAVPQVRFEIPAPESLLFRTMYEFAAPPAVSPDGRFIVFGVVGSNEGSRLWLRPLDGEPRPLAGTEGGQRPFWSPDSRSIGFFSTGELQRIEIAGGPVLGLAPVRNARGGTWNENGTIVFAEDGAGPLSRIDETGGVPVAVTKLSEGSKEASHRYPHFLPDGRHFLYLALDAQGAMGSGDESHHRLMLGSLDDDSTRLLIRGASNGVYASGHLIYRRGAALQAQPFDAERLEFAGDPVTLAEPIHYDASYERAIFTASNDVLAFVPGEFTGATRLLLLDRSGAVIKTLFDRGIQYESRFSPVEMKLASINRSEQRGEAGDVIWILDLDEGTRSRFTFGAGVARSPVWSSDGRRIAYGWTTDAGTSVRLKAVDGDGDGDGDGAPEVVLDESWGGSPTAWSRDGRYLLIQMASEGRGADIWIYDLEAGGDPQPLIESDGSISQPAISPDGRWLAYASNESGQVEVYLTRFPSAQGKWLASSGGGLDPAWDVDGETLFFHGLDHSLTAVPVSDTGGSPRVGLPSKLFDLFAPQDIGESVYALSSDGKSFAANTLLEEEMATPLTVIVGWARLLER